MTDRGFNFVVLGFDPRFFICVFRVPCCDALLFRTYSPIIPHGVMSGSVRLIRAGFPRDDMVGLAMVAIFELPPKKVYLCLNNFTVYVIHQKHDRLMDEVAAYQCVSKIDPMLCTTRYGALRIMGVLHTEDPISTALDWTSKLKARYRQLSLLVHPDKNPDHIQRATECFKSINWVCVCVRVHVHTRMRSCMRPDATSAVHCTTPYHTLLSQAYGKLQGGFRPVAYSPPPRSPPGRHYNWVRDSDSEEDESGSDTDTDTDTDTGGHHRATDDGHSDGSDVDGWMDGSNGPMSYTSQIPCLGRLCGMHMSALQSICDCDDVLVASNLWRTCLTYRTFPGRLDWFRMKHTTPRQSLWHTFVSKSMSVEDVYMFLSGFCMNVHGNRKISIGQLRKTPVERLRVKAYAMLCMCRY